MVKLLVREGILVNEKMGDGETALHAVCWEDNYSYTKKRIIRFLLRNDADVNVLNNSGNTPLTCSNTNYEKIFVKKLAILKHENQFICQKNLEYLNQKRVRKIWQDCIKELELLSGTKFFKNYSLYDVLKIFFKQNEKLFTLIKNERFKAAFQLAMSNMRASIKYFGNDLANIFYVAGIRVDVIQSEEKKLGSIFKHYLPELVIRKTASFIYEDEYLESDRSNDSDPESELEEDDDEDGFIFNFHDYSAYGYGYNPFQRWF